MQHILPTGVCLNSVLGPVAVVKEMEKTLRSKVTSLIFLVYLFVRSRQCIYKIKFIHRYNILWVIFHCFGSADIDKLNYQMSCRCCKSFETQQYLSGGFKQCLCYLKEWHCVQLYTTAGNRFKKIFLIVVNLCDFLSS